MTLCTVVISNHNYARFLGEAIESVLAQTHAEREIVVVDDGSTDETPAVLARYEGRPGIVILRQPNGGQLSAFNRALGAVRGELVFFLDADDLYEPDYLARAVGRYEADPECDFVYCRTRLFGGARGLHPDGRCASGYSILAAYHLRKWVGAPTSAISMRATLLRKILPLPLEEDWRVRADDCLVWGASLAGGCKRFLDAPLVRYRIHDANRYMGRPERTAGYWIRRDLAIEKLFRHVLEKNRVHFSPGLWVSEYLSVQDKTLRERVNYLRIALDLRLGLISLLYLPVQLWKYRRGRER